ncbi:hypothetical protein [Salana multivorans]
MLVEGPADLLVLKQHLVGAEIFPSAGKSNVLRALHLLSDWGDPAVIGVVDADFDDPADLAALDGRIWPYDERDLEAMLIGLGVLSLVLEHQGSSEKLTKYGGVEKLVRRLVEIVEPVTALRSVNSRERWGLAFDRVSIADKIDRRTLELKIDGYCAALIRASSAAPDNTAVSAACRADLPDNLGPRGRDVLEAAGVALRRIAGTLPAAASTESVLAGQLHSSAGLALASSRWLKDLKQRIEGMSLDGRSSSTGDARAVGAR